MSYDNTLAGDYLAGPSVVDANGVAVRPEGVGVTAYSLPTAIFRFRGAQQLLPTSALLREVTITNIGFVPVYLANVDPTNQFIDFTAYPGTGNSPFTPTASRLAVGAVRQFHTTLAIWANTLPIGTEAIVSVMT